MIIQYFPVCLLYIAIKGKNYEINSGVTLWQKKTKRRKRRKRETWTKDGALSYHTPSPPQKAACVPSKTRRTPLNSIAVSVFVLLFIELDKYWIQILQNHKQIQIRRTLRSGIHFSANAGRKWMWSNCVREGVFDLFWCISITIYVKSYKKIDERAQTANFSVFTMGGCWLTGALC